MLFTGGPEVPTVVIKEPPLARALSLPPGLGPTPLNDIADEADEGAPWQELSLARPPSV